MPLLCRCYAVAMPLLYQENLISFCKVTKEIGRNWNPKMGNLASIHKNILSLIYRNYLDDDDREFLIRAGGMVITKDQALVGPTAVKGYINRMNYLISRGIQLNSYICASAASGGQLEMLQFLVGIGADLSPYACANAAENNHLEVLKWLMEYNHISDAWTYFRAARGGHFRILEFLGIEGIANNIHEFHTFAAQGGNVQILQWLKDNNVLVLNENIFAIAASCKNNIKLLEWLLKEGCPTSPRACSYAVLNRDLDTLIWLRSNGCPWDKWCLNYSGSDNMKEIHKWLIDNGCPRT